MFNKHLKLVLEDCNLRDFKNLRAGMVIILEKRAKDKVVHYHGSVYCLKKINSFVLDLDVSEFYSDFLIRPRFKPRVVSFRNSSKISIFVISTGEDNMKAMAERRKAYAKARSQFSIKREKIDEYFELLKIKKDISLIDFKLVQRRNLLVHHPDKQVMSGLAASDFKVQSDSVILALNNVADFIKNRDRRIS